MKVGQLVSPAAFALALGLTISCKESSQSRLLAPLTSTDAVVSPSPTSVVIVRQAPAPEEGNVYNTLQSALSHVDPGGVIQLSDGRHYVGGFDVSISVTIEPVPGAHPVLDAQQDYSAFVIRGVAAPLTVTVKGITFENSSGSPIQVQGSIGRVTIQGSQFTPPSSPSGCCLAGVFIFQASGGPVVLVNNRFVGGDIGVGSYDAQGDVTIAANYFSGQNSGGIHTGGAPTEGRVFVVGNRVSSCGETCIGLYGPGPKDVRYNLVTDDAAQPTVAGIWDEGPAVLEDNLILGSTLPPGDPAGSYSIAHGGITFFHANSVARRNVIRNAAAGLWLDASNVQAFDLVIDHVEGAFGGWGPPLANQLTLHESNITNYQISGGVLYGVYSFSSVDARCDWWGSASGPHDTAPMLPLTQYAPWATSPIAGTGRSC